MPGSRLTVHLSRDSFNTPWGFRLQGGKDLTQPLTVQRVFSNSPADGELQRGDIILSINSRDASELTHKQAQDLIKHGGGQVQLIVNRPPPGAHIGPLSPPIVTQKPRAPSLQHPSSTSSAAGYGHQGKSYGQTPDQRVDYPHDRSGMLNRVQTSLDSITLSPRTPEVHTSSPFFQPYQQVYTPTGLLLEQQRLQTQQVDSEPIAPVWERRKQFQQGPVQTSPVKAPAKKKIQNFAKPKPAPTSYGGFGIDYSQASSKQPAGGWHPAPQFKPTPAPVPSSSIVTYTPTAIQYTPRVDPPSTRPSPLSPTYAPVQVTPATWQRKEEEDSGTPAWGSTLKRTGVKPWEMDTNYSIDQQPVRSVPYNPPPAKSPISPGPFSPSGAPHTGGSENGPKVVHLQYNSPLHLYSNQNVAETLKGQTQALAGQTKPTPPSVNEAGERDWSQSAVLRYINQEDSRKSKQPAPAVAPKPQYSPVKAPKPYQPFQQEVGSSDF